MLVSTNAIHLYDRLEDTLRAWARVLEPGGRVRINSGNVRNPRAADNEWIIDETVYVVHEVATGLVRTDPRWAAFRGVLDDPERERIPRVARPGLPRAAAGRSLPRRARASGFAIDEVTERPIEASVDEWYEFLAAYADAVLGWAGGSEKVGDDAGDTRGRRRSARAAARVAQHDLRRPADVPLLLDVHHGDPLVGRSGFATR